MTTVLLDKLAASKKALEPLKAVNCRMAHERVLIDPNSQLPIVGSIADIEFERLGLCEASKRFKNPACSHTMARYPLETALDLLAEQGNENSEWRDDLDNLSNVIHQLDHEKGEAEKQFAQLIVKIGDTENEPVKIRLLIEEKESTRAKIAWMEQKHGLLVEKIEILKNKIFAALISAIEIELERRK